MSNSDREPLYLQMERFRREVAIFAPATAYDQVAAAAVGSTTRVQDVPERDIAGGDH